MCLMSKLHIINALRVEPVYVCFQKITYGYACLRFELTLPDMMASYERIDNLPKQILVQIFNLLNNSCFDRLLWIVS